MVCGPWNHMYGPLSVCDHWQAKVSVSTYMKWDLLLTCLNCVCAYVFGCLNTGGSHEYHCLHRPKLSFTLVPACQSFALTLPNPTRDLVLWSRSRKACSVFTCLLSKTPKLWREGYGTGPQVPTQQPRSENCS